MDSTFPLGFPGPTAGYLALYVATFALHQFFMHYVLAGSLYLGGRALFPANHEAHATGRLVQLIRDWLPLMLSAAITAGVAPLLFVQIVYPKHFYTANLLLSWKWMVVVPVLIVAFYLLYLQKSKWLRGSRRVLKVTVPLVTAASFVFVGFCWTANHLLGNAEPRWPEIYESGQLGLNAIQVVVRMMVWIAGSFATLSVFVAWQIRRDESTTPVDIKHLAYMGLGGTVVSSTAVLVYLAMIGAAPRATLTGPLGSPYLMLASAGAVLQLIGWWLVRTNNRLTLVRLLMTTLGLVGSLLGLSVAREVLRIHDVDLAQLFERHAESAQVGGLTVFAISLIVNGLIIAGCIYLVRTASPQQ